MQAILENTSSHRGVVEVQQNLQYCAAWYSNLEGRLSRTSSGVNAVISICGFGWGVTAVSPLDPFEHRINIASQTSSA